MKKALSLILALVLCLSLCACAEEKESTATVIVNGEEQTVTADDIISFPDRYAGCPITVTAKVVKIDGPMYFTSYLSPDHGYEFMLASEFSDWCVHVGEDDKIMDTVNIGDTVTVSGYVKSGTNMYVCICGQKDGYMYPEYTNIKIVGDDEISSYGKESSQPSEIITQPTNLTTFRSITLSDVTTATLIVELWKAGEATDDSMKALMDEYGADQSGGILYEYYPDMFLKEIEAWVVDPSRKVGDVEIIKTEYGYNIIYIVSLGKG